MMRAYHSLLDAARSAILDRLGGNAEALENTYRELTPLWGQTLVDAAFDFAVAALEYEEAAAEKVTQQEAMARCGCWLDFHRGLSDRYRVRGFGAGGSAPSNSPSAAALWAAPSE
jgi:hypothetical protein